MSKFVLAGYKRIKNQGFTLLELLVVIVIIGLLASIAAPKLFKQIGKSETKTASAQIESLGLALDQYRIDVGQYPSTEQGLVALYKNPGNVPKWAGSYLKKNIPNDPWGKPYLYKSPGDHGDYDLFTLGKDGQLGGTEEAEDVVNW
ncbi:PulG Type II secretory pathway, pseudopilin PulG [Methylophilaceae bacterium]|jgi:general secretion pathway protein G